ncbi:hypothetical protein TD95_000844 [Thielaviopsis punctulata]|uniref:Phosphoglycerate mutase n=1 Tax=Thielaviopsis punctulata TaxID=72032 RepID=A0A0F4ZKE2_9PEZI|nr:hypothetical protein TD95_000844 [Thielaviopsis punctulata]
MARPPAYLFVVRHGMRLDAADKTWAESSPTPYDTPLCYAGWIQARAVGARIATILAQAEAESAEPDSPSLSPNDAERPHKRRRRFKVAIHCSPFLRCVQTAVGISAGLAQPITAPAPPTMNHTRRMSNPVVIPSPIMKPTGSSKRPTLDATDAQHHHHFHKAILRLDEFLGEWLSADYYETISPPPKTSTMISNAKAQLLKREVYAKHFHQSISSPISPAPVLSPQLWTGGRAIESVPEDPFEGSSDSEPEQENLPPPKPLGECGYIAPVPQFAISSSDKIPDGYVAHARDSCLVFDYQWESASKDLDWGDGGSFPEEWTSMHNRFRKGVQGLVDWYSSTEDAADIAHVRGAAEKDKLEDTWSEDGDDDVDIENVVIMVSHGAGCNALIGAMTHQPALMDVNMASLTMAVRKTGKDYEHVSPWLPNTDQTDDTSLSTVKNSIPVHQYYDMRLIASTEHLRTASSSADIARAGVIPPWAPNVKKPVANRGRGFSLTGPSSPLKPTATARTQNITWSHSRSTSMSASIGLPDTGLFGPRKEEDADYQFSSIKQGGITVGSGMTSFIKKRDAEGICKTAKPTPLKTNFAAASSKVLSAKSLSGINSGSKINSPLSTSTTYSSMKESPPLTGLSTATSSKSGLWGLSSVSASSKTLMEVDEDEDEDEMFPDFDNKKKFTPPISQNASQRTSPSLLSLKLKSGSVSPPLASPTLLSLSSEFSSNKIPAAPAMVVTSAERSSSQENSGIGMSFGSVSFGSSPRLDRLGVAPERSPIHSPIGSPIREPIASPFFNDGGSGSGEPFIRSRITTSRLWGAPGS